MAFEDAGGEVGRRKVFGCVVFNGNIYDNHPFLADRFGLIPWSGERQDFLKGDD